ncbi:MAG: PEGA domain-containing protein [Myxococcales bacterium]|nr:PEGA domain-containing protein [Myxococcales bacterium]
MSSVRFAAFELVAPVSTGPDLEVSLARWDPAQAPGGRAWPVRLIRRPPENPPDPAADAAFLAAARQAAGLRHPSLVATLASGVAEGRPWVAQELVVGVTVTDLVEALARAGQAAPPDVVVLVAVRLIEALNHVHGAEAPEPALQAHGAVGPDTVWLTRRGEVKLDGYRSLDGASGVVAPELLFGGLPGPSADLFGLGATIAELLHGRPLPEYGQVVLQKALVERPDLPAPLVALVQALTAPYPEQRPARGGWGELDLLLADPVAAAGTLGQWVEALGAGERPAARLLAEVADAPYPPPTVGVPAPRLTLPLPQGHKAAPVVAPVEPAPALLSFEGSGPPGRPMPDVVTRNRSSEGGLPAWLMVMMGILSVVGAVALGQLFVSHDPEEPARPPARPTAAALTRGGTLTVISDPPGATVYVDGTPRQQETPATFTGEPTGKPLKIHVAREGYASSEVQEVTISGTTKVAQASFRLKRMYRYRVETEPPGVELSVQGRNARVKTPVELEPLIAGERVTVDVVGEGWMPEQLELVASARTATVARLALRPARTLVVESTPAGAEVLIDGVRVGRTPLERAVPLGAPVEVVVVRPDSGRWTKRVVPRAVGREVLKARLQLLPLSKLPLDAQERDDLARVQARLQAALRTLSKARAEQKVAERKVASFQHQRTLDLSALEEAKDAREAAAERAALAESERDTARAEEEELRRAILQRLEQVFEP